MAKAQRVVANDRTEARKRLTTLPYQFDGSDNAGRGAKNPQPSGVSMDTPQNLPTSARGTRSAHLAGRVSRMLNFPDVVWAEITIDGAVDLFREIRVRNPMRNDDGSMTELKVGDRVGIRVSLDV